MTTPSMADYWRASDDATADAHTFSEFMLGVLSRLVDEATWERALLLAVKCDEELPRRGVAS